MSRDRPQDLPGSRFGVFGWVGSDLGSCSRDKKTRSRSRGRNGRSRRRDANSSSMNMIDRILTVGGLTLLSRLTGFVRDILMAAVLGAGPVADAFLVAFRLPNHF